jgi:ABC-type dipeptide/oligopeptide/nickel transport system permease subunit
LSASELLLDNAPPGGEAPEAIRQDIAARSPLDLFWRRFREDRVAMVSLVFIVVLILIAIFAPLIVKLLGLPGPNKDNTLLLDSFGSPAGPSGAHPLGVDDFGRDILSRVIYGSRVSLEVAFISTGIAVVVGVTVGMIAGYYRGWVDTALSRLMDVVLAFPLLLLAIGLASACTLGKGCLPIHRHLVGWIIAGIGALWLALNFGYRAWVRSRYRAPAGGSWIAPAVGGAIVVAGLVVALFSHNSDNALITPGFTVLIVTIALASWPYIGRIVRGQVLSLREKEFVEASRSLGASNTRIIFREILPNLVAPIIVYSSLVLPTNILFEAALSYLGVGVQFPTASWGQMISDATPIFASAWWYMVFPGAALVLTVLAFNLVGDGLQDALNPKSNR